MDERDSAVCSKREVRAGFLALRAATDARVYAERSAALCAALLALPTLSSARVVHACWPAVERGEPDLRPLLHAFLRRGQTVVLPRVTARRPPTLAHHVWSGEALRPGAHGLLEPAPDAPDADLRDLDIVLVPALAADLRGVRVGYGGGYYDAFLAEPTRRAAPPLLVCPLFAAAVSQTPLPCEPHDVPVDVLVTEDGPVWTAAGRGSAEGARIRRRRS